MRHLARALLILFAFAVPWEYSLDLGYPFGNVARMVALLLLAVGMLALLPSGLTRSPGALQWAVLALFLWMCCTRFWSIDPEATSIRLRAYFQEMITVLLVWEFAEDRSDLRWLLRAYVGGSWVLAVLSLADAVALHSTGQIRFAAEGQDPNDVARFLVLGLPAAALLAVWESKWAGRLFGFGFIAVGTLAILLTASREGALAALVALTGCAVVFFHDRSRLFLVGIAALAGVAAGFLFLAPRATIERLGTIPEQLRRGDLNQRFNIWDAGWRAFAHAPFLGNGAGTFVSAAGTANADTAHNTALSIAVEGGVFALILAALVVAISAAAVIRMRGPLRVTFGTLLLVWLVSSVVATVEQTRATWLLIGIISFAARLTEETPRGADCSHTQGAAIEAV